MVSARRMSSGGTVAVWLYLLALASFLSSAAPVVGQAIPILPLDETFVQDRTSTVSDRVVNVWRPIGADDYHPHAQELSPHRRTAMGFAVGATVSALTLSAALGWGACTGSGDYLEVCRIIYLGGTAVGAGIGALLGYAIGRDAPPGRAQGVLWGTTLGALGVFSLSLLACEQADDANPSLVCGTHGMPTVTNTALFALGGGLVSFALGASWGEAAARRVTLTPGPDGSTSLALTVPLGP